MTSIGEMKPVTLQAPLLRLIGVREWGLPTLVTPGQIWRSRTTGYVSCMLPKGRDQVTTETRLLHIVEPNEKQWMPKAWRKAIWQYVKEYPYSGYDLGPFLDVNDEARNKLLRKLARELVNADEIGARSIAHAIGGIAALGMTIDDV